jgi:hypothetical protein
LKVEWASENDKVILEMVPEGKRSAEDTPLSSWRDLFMEMEKDGMVDYTVNTHIVEHPQPDGPEDAPYNIKPKLPTDVTPMVFAWKTPTTMTVNSVASYFRAQDRATSYGQNLQ